MKEQLRAFWDGRRREIGPYFAALGRWYLLAAAVGLLCGGVGAAFALSIEKVTALRAQWPWLLYLLPLAGLGIALLYHLGGLDNDRGTNFMLEGARAETRPPLRLGALIFAGTVLTHLCGGSSGREGAALQIGGCIGLAIGRRLHLAQESRVMLLVCGMSGLFSALFGTPVAAAVFSIEVVSVGIFQHAALFPCLLSATVAGQVARLLGVSPTAYQLAAPAAGEARLTFLTALLGLGCAAVSILFCVAMHAAHSLYAKYLPNPFARAAVGGALVVLLTLLCGSQTYNGAGGPVIAAALAGQAGGAMFLVKLLFTAVTLGAGFKGGEIVPAFFVGSTFGCLLGGWLGLGPGFGAALGLVAVFCGVTNCPLASILLSVELFGGGQLPMFALACAVSYLMSGRYSLYESQKLALPKLRISLEETVAMH